MKISDRTELLMSAAVALAQAGRMKSTIHLKGHDIFVSNMDDTILMKFRAEEDFDELSFFANDYDSRDIKEENGQVVFVSLAEQYKRKKVCPKPPQTFAEVEQIWGKHKPNLGIPIRIGKAALQLLDEELSHVELHNIDGSVKLFQKNIYTGARIEISEASAGALLLEIASDPPLSNLPIGLRTSDFKALFSFSDQLLFYIQDGNWIYFKDSSNALQGIVSTCLYDELPWVGKSKEA